MGSLRRQITVFGGFLSVLAALPGCVDFSYETASTPAPGRGAVVADEPRAVLVARNILAAGGNATDAAVALYFAMAATYPGSAGLGGGGVCVARKAGISRSDRPQTDAIDFTSPMPSGTPPDGLSPIGVPGNVRGMFALHARFGKLRWAQLILPGESLSRFGIPVSRAFAKELAVGEDRFAADLASRKVYRRPDGSLLREGDNLAQIDLAGVLGRIRAVGAGDFYSGEVARTLVSGARDAGAYLSIEDLRRFKPKWIKAVEREYGSYTVYFPEARVAGGAIAADLWKTLYQDGQYRRSSVENRDGAIVKATADAMSRRGVGLTGASNGAEDTLADPAVTGFAVLDGAGGAVACAVTMNGRFGSGQLIRGTGIVAAAASGGPNDGRRALAPMVVASRNIDTTIAAAAPSGDLSAPTALISVALRLLRDDEDIGEALGAARAFPGIADKTVYVERRGTGAPRLGRSGDLRRIPVSSLGRVNFIYCSDGLPLRPESCVFGSDPRGFGYAVNAEPIEE